LVPDAKNRTFALEAANHCSTIAPDEALLRRHLRTCGACTQTTQLQPANLHWPQACHRACTDDTHGAKLLDAIQRCRHALQAKAFKTRDPSALASTLQRCVPKRRGITSDALGWRTL
jgi:hypothetical protein